LRNSGGRESLDRIRDTLDRAALAEDREQYAASKQQTNDPHPKTCGQSKKAWQEVAANLGN
jgi:hypothetical protein